MHDAGTCCPEPLTCQRDRFDLPDDLHYLNGTYMSPLSRAVLAAGNNGLQPSPPQKPGRAATPGMPRSSRRSTTSPPW